jgi:hypothetical protein
MALETLCFSCGLAVGVPPRLNRLQNGQVCPSCRDRVLDSLPAPFPFRSPAPASLDTDDLAFDRHGEDPRGA